MNDEVLIPKMKRISKRRKKISIPWLNIVIIIFCVLLLICATFVNLDIKHYIIPSDIFTNKNLNINNFIYAFCIIPQIPVVMFITSALGRKMALTCIILYLLAGLFFIPIFALGGGGRYIAQYGVGYLIAYIPAVILAGNILNEKYSFANMIKSAFWGVITIHIIGVLYMIFIALIKHTGTDFIAGWIASQSGLKIVYDLILSFLLILIGKYVNSALKFIIE